MILSKLFKGKKVKITCPDENCSRIFKIYIDKLLGKDQSITCPACKSAINLEHEGSIKNLREKLKKNLT